jgi:hypothetical protein
VAISGLKGRQTLGWCFEGVRAQATLGRRWVAVGAEEAQSLISIEVKEVQIYFQIMSSSHRNQEGEI